MFVEVYIVNIYFFSFIFFFLFQVYLVERQNIFFCLLEEVSCVVSRSEKTLIHFSKFKNESKKYCVSTKDYYTPFNNKKGGFIINHLKKNFSLTKNLFPTSLKIAMYESNFCKVLCL
eukprot:TRINITY_DN9772_c2_g1_i1.p1 TRINITY_DN9772_c2_g1~~TRINITY_DN9772_c2_g1_i1.p1  ORF type:complete len:117 (-),score=5.81 TRINITY_DN9772_c2_g1_i1:60-410(-)